MLDTYFHENGRSKLISYENMADVIALATTGNLIIIKIKRIICGGSCWSDAQQWVYDNM